MLRAICIPALILGYVGAAIVWRHAADPSVKDGPLPTPPPAHLAGPSVVADLPPLSPHRRVRVGPVLRVRASHGTPLFPSASRSPVRFRSGRRRRRGRRRRPRSPCSPCSRRSPSRPRSRRRRARRRHPRRHRADTGSGRRSAPRSARRDDPDDAGRRGSRTDTARPDAGHITTARRHAAACDSADRRAAGRAAAPVVPPPDTPPPSHEPHHDPQPGNGFGDDNHVHTGPPGQTDPSHGQSDQSHGHH